jgi:probable rRNA maturation factor
MAADATVVVADERSPERRDDHLDLPRWERLARAVLDDEQASGELTLTFVDEAEIADLNAEHMGASGPTDVLSFPIDDDDPLPDVPRLLGDVVICPSVAAAQCADHAGSYDDELALLIVHGILHIRGHDHAEPAETARMRTRELELLERHHWNGPAPARFRQDQD